MTSLLVLVSTKEIKWENTVQREQFWVLWVCPHAIPYDIILGRSSGIWLWTSGMPGPCWIAIEAGRTQSTVKTKHIRDAASSRDSRVGKRGWSTQYRSSCDLINLEG